MLFLIFLKLTEVIKRKITSKEIKTFLHARKGRVCKLISVAIIFIYDTEKQFSSLKISPLFSTSCTTLHNLI